MQLLRAPYLLPISSSAIQDAAILLEGDEILALGSYEEIKKDTRSQKANIINLESTVLLPGFINAHCHLELTQLEGFQTQGTFTDWIKALVERKSAYTEADIQKSFEVGIQRLLNGGCTTVADHVSIGTDFSPLLKSNIRSRVILEALGVNLDVAQKLFDVGENIESTPFEKGGEIARAISGISSLKIPPNLPFTKGGTSIHLSPHSAHSLHFSILEKLLRSDRKFFSIHLGESEEEEEFFKKKSGKLFEFIKSRNTKWIPDLVENDGVGSSIQYLEKHSLLSDKILAIHCNYLDQEDIALLKKHQMSVVHCPTSHAYFGHQRFKLDELKDAGINIALGTDSLSSGSSLSMLDQVRLAKNNYPHISDNEWLYMLTLGGAKALKMDSEIGSLEVGKKADLIGFQLNSHKLLNEQSVMQAILKKEKADFVFCQGHELTKRSLKANSYDNNNC